MACAHPASKETLDRPVERRDARVKDAWDDGKIERGQAMMDRGGPSRPEPESPGVKRDGEDTLQHRYHLSASFLSVPEHLDGPSGKISSACTQAYLP